MAVVIEEFLEQIDMNFSSMKEELYAQVPKEYPYFMRVENTDKPFVKAGYISGLGKPIQNRDLEPLPISKPYKGYTSYFVPVNYRLAYMIERQMIEDEQWGLLASRPSSMLYAESVMKDEVAANILNNGLTSQSYDIGGTALFSTAHAREDGMATWSNLDNTQKPITVEVVFNAITDLLYNLKNMIGLPIMYSGVFNIYVPAINGELWQQALEVANSVQHPGTSDNKINPLINQFNIQVIPLRYLTNPDLWFIGWQPSAQGYGLIMYTRQMPDISPLKEVANNPDAWFSRLRTRFVPGYENKRGIVAIGAS